MSSVTTSTHKTFYGRRTGGPILCKQEYAAMIDAAVAPGLQAAPGGHIIAARGAIRTGAQEELYRADAAGGRYARALAEVLREAGATLYAGATNTHMVAVDLLARRWTDTGLKTALTSTGSPPTLSGCRSAALAGGSDYGLARCRSQIRGLNAAIWHRFGHEIRNLLRREEDLRRRDRIAEWARQYPLLRLLSCFS